MSRDLAQLKHKLKEMVISVCDLDGVEPDDIDDDERLIGGRHDLNSLDSIEIAAAIDYEFGVRIEDLSAAKAAFRSIQTLAEHVDRETGRPA